MASALRRMSVQEHSSREPANGGMAERESLELSLSFRPLEEALKVAYHLKRIWPHETTSV